MTELSYPIVTPLIFHTKAPLHVSDRARLNSQMLGKKKKKSCETKRGTSVHLFFQGNAAMRAGSFAVCTMGLTVRASNTLLSAMPCSWTPKTGLSINVAPPE